MKQRPIVDLVYFDAGGGHRSAAMALEKVIQASDYPWDVRLVNLQEVLDPLDVFRKVTRVRLQDLYNLMLAKGWTLGSRQLLRPMQGVIRIYHRPAVKLLGQYWRNQRPDMVVSLVPNLNRALFESIEEALPGVPFVTILTDFADFPPHFWMEDQEQYFICGTERAVQQAFDMRHHVSRVFRVSGMILRPEFYDPQHVERDRERVRLGLDPHTPTGLVLFGGAGANKMLSIARRLGNSKLDVQLIMICGRNTKLRARLEKLKARSKIFVEGFTKDIAHYMRLSDFLIGKPGPGSISEALKMQLPVIIEKNAWTLPQEHYNAEWVREHGAGIVLKSFNDIEAGVADLLAEDRLSGMRAKISSLENRAVYEIPEILERVLLKHASGRAASKEEGVSYGRNT